MKVVGTYLPKDAGESYWFGRDYFNAHSTGTGPDTVDSVFVDQATFPGIVADPQYPFEIDVDFPLDANQIRLADLTALKGDVAHLQLKYSPLASIQVTTGLAGVLAAAGASAFAGGHRDVAGHVAAWRCSPGWCCSR